MQAALNRQCEYYRNLLLHSYGLAGLDSTGCRTSSPGGVGPGSIPGEVKPSTIKVEVVALWPGIQY